MGTATKAPPFELRSLYPSDTPLFNKTSNCTSSLQPVLKATGPRLSLAERTRRMANIRTEAEYIDPVTAGVMTADQMERALVE